MEDFTAIVEEAEDYERATEIAPPKVSSYVDLTRYSIPIFYTKNGTIVVGKSRVERCWSIDAYGMPLIYTKRNRKGEDMRSPRWLNILFELTYHLMDTNFKPWFKNTQYFRDNCQFLYLDGDVTNHAINNILPFITLLKKFGIYNHCPDSKKCVESVLSEHPNAITWLNVPLTEEFVNAFVGRDHHRAMMPKRYDHDDSYRLPLPSKPIDAETRDILYTKYKAMFSNMSYIEPYRRETDIYIMTHYWIRCT